eukprot:gene7840-biopygen4592
MRRRRRRKKRKEIDCSAAGAAKVQMMISQYVSMFPGQGYFLCATHPPPPPPPPRRAAPRRAAALRSAAQRRGHRTCPRHARTMPAPRPRHPSQKMPIEGGARKLTELANKFLDKDHASHPLHEMVNSARIMQVLLEQEERKRQVRTSSASPLQQRASVPDKLASPLRQRQGTGQVEQLDKPDKPGK